METAEICKVAVSAAPYAIDKPYDYLIPEHLLASAVPGVRVTEGVILARGSGGKLPGLKPLAAVLDREPVLDRADIELALWMRRRYFCTLFEAVKAILPVGLWYQLREVWRLADPGMDRLTADSAAAAVRQALPVLDALYEAGGRAELAALSARCGERTEETLRRLQEAGIVIRETAARRKIADKTRQMVELAVAAEDALALTEPKRRSAPARYEVVRLLASAGRVSAADVRYFTGASARVLKAMEKGGLIAFTQEEELRVPETGPVDPPPSIQLNEEQQAAFADPGTDGNRQGGSGPASRRHRQRKDPGIYPSGQGGAGQGQDSHGAGARNYPDAPNDAEIFLLFRGAGSHVPQRPPDDGAVRPVETGPPGRGPGSAGHPFCCFCTPAEPGPRHP